MRARARTHAHTHTLARQVKLSKHKRMLKHVKGFSLESLERMSNGTFAYNSAWGPARVIAGARGSEGDDNRDR